jgi:hypothetical protein
MSIFLLYLIKFYTYIRDVYEYFYEIGQDQYSCLKTNILEDTFTDVFYYDFNKSKKIRLRNNSNIFVLLYLYYYKYCLKKNISRYTHLSILNYAIPTSESGIFELVYYSNKKEYKYYTKRNHIDLHEIASLLLSKSSSKVLYASLLDSYEITEFINEHIQSFTKENDIQVLDLAILLLLQKYEVPYDRNLYIKIIDDSTLEERIFKDNDTIIITES